MRLSIATKIGRDRVKLFPLEACRSGEIPSRKKNFFSTRTHSPQFWFTALSTPGRKMANSDWNGEVPELLSTHNPHLVLRTTTLSVVFAPRPTPIFGGFFLDRHHSLGECTNSHTTPTDLTKTIFTTTSISNHSISESLNKKDMTAPSTLNLRPPRHSSRSL